MENQQARLQPTRSLDPQMKNVWRISAAIWILLTFILCAASFVIVLLVDEYADWARIVLLAELAAFIAFALVYMFAIVPFRYARFKYELYSSFLVISKGIIWRNHYVIPFIRVQNTDTSQGPILRMFHLASVTVSTAAGEHEIPGLPFELAEQVRDKAAELARIAREDV